MMDQLETYLRQLNLIYFTIGECLILLCMAIWNLIIINYDDCHSCIHNNIIFTVAEFHSLFLLWGGGGIADGSPKANYVPVYSQQWLQI